MQGRGALAGVAAAAVHLAGQPPPVRQVDGRRGAHRRPAQAGSRAVQAGGHRQPQVEAEERAGRRTEVVEEEGIAPLVGDHEVEPAVAVDVAHRDAAADLGVAEPQLPGEVEVAA